MRAEVEKQFEAIGEDLDAAVDAVECDFDSEEGREARFRKFYDLPATGGLTAAMLDESLSAWRRCDMTEAWLEGLTERLEEVRAVSMRLRAPGWAQFAAFVDGLEAKARVVPLGEEDAVRGASVFNWRALFARGARAALAKALSEAPCP